jgi:electron transport complex protein RnfC
MKRTRNLPALTCNEMKISEAPEPKEVLLPLRGFDSKKDRLKIKEGTRVITGEQIIPGVLSTVTGTIKGIEPLFAANTADGNGNGGVTAVRIEVSEKEEWAPTVKQEPDFLEKEPLELLEKLNHANLGFREDFETIKHVNTVIVSAVDTDPVQWVSQQVLREDKDIVLEGLRLIRHLTSAEQVVLAVPEPLAYLVRDAVNAEEGLKLYPVKPLYPNGLPEILVRDMAGVYNLDNHLFLKIEKLAASVRALKEGRPFVYKVVSVTDKEGSRNFRVRIGSPLKDLLALKGCFLKDDDKIIIGGPLRGYTCFDANIPITDDVDSIYVQHSDANEVIHYWNNQCMNCGRCVRACPVNLDVNLIGRYSEFSLFEKCHEMDVMVCIECGLCAYHCPSGRSLVQFIRLAKKQKMENM